MSYTNDLTNLANIASVVTSGITSNGTAITKISVGNTTVNATVNSTGVYVNGSAVYQTTADAAALYQTTAGLSANVLLLTAGQLGNSSGTIGNVTSWITGNAATAYTNAVTYSTNASNLGNGTVAPARLGSGTANSTTILYGNSVFAAAPDSTNASALISGTVAPARLGTGTTNSSTILYGNSVWAAAPSSTNASALTTGTVNTALLGSGTANSSTILYGNGVWASSSGASLVKQQYTANGTGTQFAVSGGYSAGAMTVYVNGVKQLETTDVITSSGANVVFNTAPPSNAQIDIFGFSSLPQIASNTSVVTQQFTANGTANSFTVSGGYTAGSMQVFVNGVKYVESSDVVTNSGTTVNFTIAPANGSIVDVFGQVSTPAVTANSLLLIGGTVSGTVNVGSNVSLSTTTLNIGNSTVNTAVNSTGIYVNGSVIGLYGSRTLTTDSLLLSTDGIVQANNSLTLTLMAASTVTGKQFYVININTSNVNIIGNTSSETINGYANIMMQFKNSSLGLISTGSSWIIN